MSMEKYSKTARIVLFIVYLVGVAGLSVPQWRGLFGELTPVNLLFAAVLLFAFHHTYDRKSVGMFLLVLLGGFLAEFAGVQTGLVFGTYAYGSALGVKIGGTPLIIGLNWLMLIYMVHHLLQGLQAHILWKSLVGALMMVAYDLLLEPVAIQLDFWHWDGGAIPLQNYLAWFAISFLFIFIWNLVRVKTFNSVSNTLLGIQLSFFMILNLTL
jgi:putative membrane protein